MTSAERVIEYTQIPPEEDFVDSPGPDSPLPVAVTTGAKWPAHGEIVFRMMSLKYSKESPYVLKDISAVIQPGYEVMEGKRSDLSQS